IDALHALQKEGTAGAGSIWEGLMLGKTVRVPRHIELSEPGRRRTWPPLVSNCSPKACTSEFWKYGTGGTGSGTRKHLMSCSLDSYYFGHLEECSFFLTWRIFVVIIHRLARAGRSCRANVTTLYI